MDDEEEPCQREGGLRRTAIMPNLATQREVLLCKKKDYGCCEYTRRKRLNVSDITTRT